MSETATTTTTKRVIKAGGAKGEAIVAALTAEPGLTRAQVAEKVGATTGRVGEVLRHLAANGTSAEKALVAKHVASQPVREKKAPAPKPAKTAKAAAAKTATPKATTSRTRKAAQPKA